MPLVKAVCAFQRLSGIPGDEVVNDWYFLWNDSINPPVEADFDDVTLALQHFYGERNTGQSLAVGEYMSEALNRTPGFTVTYYGVDIATGVMGAPVFSDSAAFYAAAAGTPLPSECAAVLSFSSDYGTDVEFGAGGTRPRARRRGRVYIGPLQGGANTETEDSVTHETTILNGLRDDATKAARSQFSNGLASSPLNGTEWRWAQYSRVDARASYVEFCWMDNAFDVQRRRGQAATARTNVVIDANP